MARTRIARPLGKMTPRERPRLRPCLGPDCDHLILSTKGARLCARARGQVARTDGYFSAFTDAVIGHRVFTPIRGLDTAAAEA